jgi:uncharacterized protein with PIN domain
MKFIVDAMFGRLARWLRMSGYDTTYDVDFKDGRMVMAAKNEGRILITRDKDVHQRALKEKIKSTYISSLDFLDQLKQIESEYGVVFKEIPEFTRCPRCNHRLYKADKNDIKSKLPEKVGEIYDEYWVCKGCARIYWHGGHWKNIKETVDRLKEQAK